jgi:hypothetical protein
MIAIQCRGACITTTAFSHQPFDLCRLYRKDLDTSFNEGILYIALNPLCHKLSPTTNLAPRGQQRPKPSYMPPTNLR